MNALGSKTRQMVRHHLEERKAEAARQEKFDSLARENPALAAPRDRRFIQDAQAYWLRHLGSHINPRWHIACANVTGVEDVRYVPQDVWKERIIPYFNDGELRPTYSDKNLYDRLIRDASSPRVLLKRVRGWYYDGDNAPRSRERAFAEILANDQTLIIKPSRTDNGEGVRKLEVRGGELHLEESPRSVDWIEAQYGPDYLIQRLIRQHAVLAAVHPESVNTLRIRTLRWDGSVATIGCMVRFGVGGMVNDNGGAGGVACGVGEDGRMHALAIDGCGRHYPRHPTTGYDFSQRPEVPGLAAAYARVVELHRELLHFDLVGWDIAIAEDGSPVCLEANFRGSVYMFQFASGKPVFGEMTPDVLAAVRRGRPQPRFR